MIHYQLRCDADHAFDGWFRDSGTFDRQAEAGLVTCPECGDAKVHRALMAPSIGRARAVVDQSGQDQTPQDRPSRSAAPPAPPAKAAAGMPDKMRAVLQRLRSEVERNCEHVGDRFADEARAIHRGESEGRPIYGESTPEQAQALADDGIEVARIPWIPRADG